MARNDGKAENQHYVPRVLLQNFAFPGSGKEPKVFAFDKSTGRSFPTGINKIAAERGYNDATLKDVPFTLEPALAWLEGEARAPLAKIIAERTLSALTKQEKENLSFFVAAQFLRSKNMREVNRHVNESLVAWIRKRGGDPERVRGLRPVIGDEEMKAEHVRMIETLAPKFGRVLLHTKQWILFSTHEQDPFWISDNPVVRHNADNTSAFGTIGLASPGVEIYLPICPTLLLGMWCHSNVKMFQLARTGVSRMIESIRSRPEFRPGVDDVILKNSKTLAQAHVASILAAVEGGTPAGCEPENVVFYNWLQTFWAERYVLSNQAGFALARKIISEDAAVRSGPRMRVD